MKNISEIKLANERNKLDTQERQLEQKLDKVIESLLRENDPRIINETISNAVVNELRQIFSQLTDKQQISLSKKVIEKTTEELTKRKDKNILDALGGAGASAVEVESVKSQETEEIKSRIEHLKQERKKVGSVSDIKYIDRKEQAGEKLSQSEIDRRERYKELSDAIDSLEGKKL